MERRTSSLAAIGVQSKLRDQEEFAAGIGQAGIHGFVIVRKNAQQRQLPQRRLNGRPSPGLGIFDPEADQHEKSFADGGDALSVHIHGCLADALNDQTHAQSLSGFSQVAGLSRPDLDNASFSSYS